MGTYFLFPVLLLTFHVTMDKSFCFSVRLFPSPPFDCIVCLDCKHFRAGAGIMSPCLCVMPGAVLIDDSK